jgi:hypothetical protein
MIFEARSSFVVYSWGVADKMGFGERAQLSLLIELRRLFLHGTSNFISSPRCIGRGRRKMTRAAMDMNVYAIAGS